MLKAIEIYKLVRSIERFEDLTYIESPALGILVSCKGRIHTKSGDALLRISFRDTFPYSKPIIHRLMNGEILATPHINRRGNICYIDDNNYVVDFTNPLGIISESLDRAINILENNEGQTQQQAFVAEFNSFWLDYSNLKVCLSILPVEKNITKITCCITPKNSVLGKDKKQITEYLNRTGQNYIPGKLNWQSAVYIPLPIKTEVDLPPLNSFWKKKDIWKFIKKNMGAWGMSKVNRIMCKNLYQPIIFNLPMEGEDNIHFGVHFEKNRDRVKTGPLFIERLDKEYAFPRAGAKQSIHDKKVMIIGCGAIGGYIAVNLSQLGVGDLTLVDSQNYSASNVHRHVLGAKEEIFFSKVDGLKKEIEGKFIHTNVNAITDDIENYIRNKTDVFSKMDLVIIATGNPSTNFWLNQYLLKNNTNLPTIYTWVDPYGIGGHTLVTNNNNKKGCYQCLYKSDPELGMYNMASFAKKGQSFLKTQSGCAGFFVPYSALDAQQTSLQTVRIAIRILEGKEEDNPLISWQGDKTDFLSNGFQLSLRYNQNPEELWKRRNQYPNPKCSICQDKAKESYLGVLKEAG